MPGDAITPSDEGVAMGAGLRRDSPRAGQAVINPCVQLPLTSTDPINGPSPELARTLMLQRAHR